MNDSSFTNCISEINKTQIDNAKDLHVVTSLCNLIEYSENYSKHREAYTNFAYMSQNIL